MASTTAICTSYKVDLLFGRHNFAASGGDSMRIALYTSTATHGAATTAYSATNEVAGTGYVAKGNLLTNIDPVASGTTALTDFPDSTWSAATRSYRMTCAAVRQWWWAIMCMPAPRTVRTTNTHTSSIPKRRH